MNLTIAIRTLYAVTLLAGAVHRTLIAYDHYLRIDARRTRNSKEPRGPGLRDVLRRRVYPEEDVHVGIHPGQEVQGTRGSDTLTDRDDIPLGEFDPTTGDFRGY